MFAETRPVPWTSPRTLQLPPAERLWAALAWTLACTTLLYVGIQGLTWLPAHLDGWLRALGDRLDALAPLAALVAMAVRGGQRAGAAIDSQLADAWTAAAARTLMVLTLAAVTTSAALALLLPA